MDQHAIFGFWLYLPFYFIFTGSFNLDSTAFSLIFFYSMLPDFDSIYYFFKSRGKIQLNEKFQHHYKSIAHYPLLYTPLIVMFIISLILNNNPIYFLAPVVGVYGGHFLFDTIACGDGIMWGKNPLSRKGYGRFFNYYCAKTDGYHGKYWYVRYRKTKINKIGNVLIIATMVLFSLIRYDSRPNPSYEYTFSPYSLIGPIIFSIILILVLRDLYSKKWKQEPPNGRYSDYRIDPSYYNGLSDKNKQRHLEKCQLLFNKNDLITLKSSI